MTTPAYTLRATTAADADWINWLEEHCMRAYAEALWDEWIPSIDQHGFEPDRHRIVVVDGEDCGVIDIMNEPDHLFLSKFYLVDNMRGKGLGAVLLKQLRTEAETAGKPLRLSVLTTNPRALKFYEREGFACIEGDAERIFMEHRG